ncbi:MAG: DUF4097 family beta strand repeat-containing protein [Thermomicrobiales bacterium]
MSDNETQPIPSSLPTTTSPSEDAMSTTTPITSAMTPIQGSNAFEQHIQVDPSQPIDLSVTNASGRVEVVATETRTIHVIVNRTDGQHEDEPEIVVSVNGNQVSVRPSWMAASGISGFAKKLKDQLQNGLNTNDWKFEGLKFTPDLDYNIWVEVPRNQVDGSRFAVKTASGRATVKGLRDSVSIATASGRIDAGNLDGQIAAHTASGSISLANITGKLEANTASGSISLQGGEAWTTLRSVSGKVAIDRFTLKNARITTVSGGIQGAAIFNNTTDYQFESVSGSIKMDVVAPVDSTTTLEFKSMSGSAKPNGFVMTGKNAWSIGSGPQGPALKARTVSGSLKLDAHPESSIPTRHDAPPQPTFVMTDNEADETTAPFTRSSVAPVPPVPPVPPAAPFGARSEHQQPGQPAEPMFTPPADWPDWIKATARSVEETARHVVTSFQQPLAPFDAQAPAAPQAPQAAPAPMTPPAAEAPAPADAPKRTITFVPKNDAPAVPAPEASAVADAPADTTQLANQDEAERLRILEAVERGEIDIDEALARIDRDGDAKA